MTRRPAANHGAPHEPAAVVERFSAQALEAGVPVDEELLLRVLTFFCERRTCHRPMSTAAARMFL